MISRKMVGNISARSAGFTELARKSMGPRETDGATNASGYDIVGLFGALPPYNYQETSNEAQKEVGNDVLWDCTSAAMGHIHTAFDQSLPSKYHQIYQ